MNDLERNKAAVIAFYDLMFNQSKPAEAIGKFAGSVYIRHNPLVGDGSRLSSNISPEWPLNSRESAFLSNV